MLSQFDNDNNSRIRRSKSTTSVKDRRKHPIISEPLDPESAKAQALIAAHRAMDRSRGSTADGLNRSDSAVSRNSARSNPRQLPARPFGSQQRATGLRAANTLPSKSADLPSYNQPCLTEFGAVGDGQPSSYRKLRQAKSFLHTSRG